ncbi:hypothetical protein M413DRAFT_446558 [Hebeloma cylindrosporum]|uniref:rRNA-processing protein EFG1 n=1 Tax=Hebeloma cylindrosporum TaxID=76867 RepID=A0A0C3BUL5_HEBCY|nr:hypothetical protein M413DRAFT_446558 [Hebeloma cylindrosporum h7]
MPPSRTQDKHSNAESSSSKQKRHYQRKNQQEEESSTTPGVQKVKAALRQTRRLLAKDTLAADVRVETERRLKALELELQQAELAKKERGFAQRYHKIKFFERQKVTRKLKQVKKGLESEDNPASQKKLSSELDDLRVDLNYILHYPKTKKYISLFPPEVRKGEEPSAASLVEAKKTNADREEVRAWIREQMKQSQLPTEPEREVLSHSKAKTGKTQSQKWPQEAGSAALTTVELETVDVPEDDFFGEDDS